LVSDGRVNEAGERPRSLVPFGTARPLTCILWKRPQHKQTLYGLRGEVVRPMTSLLLHHHPEISDDIISDASFRSARTP
jgi:hypothetical protein